MQYVVFKSGPVTCNVVECGAFCFADKGLEVPDLQFHFLAATGTEAGVPSSAQDLRGLPSTCIPLGPETGEPFGFARQGWRIRPSLTRISWRSPTTSRPRSKVCGSAATFSRNRPSQGISGRFVFRTRKPGPGRTSKPTPASSGALLIIRPVPERCARTTHRLSNRKSAFAGLTGSGFATARSCRASSVQTPTRRR